MLVPVLLRHSQTPITKRQSAILVLTDYASASLAHRSLALKQDTVSRDSQLRATGSAFSHVFHEVKMRSHCLTPITLYQNKHKLKRLSSRVLRPRRLLVS